MRKGMFKLSRFLLIRQFSYNIMESPYFMNKRMTRSQANGEIKSENDFNMNKLQQNSTNMNKKIKKRESELNFKKRKAVKIQLEDDVGLQAKKKGDVVKKGSVQDEKIKVDLSSDGWMPRNWETVLKNIQKMRSNADAPVDTMGCDQTKDEKYTPKVWPAF